ncbi:MULTISPECIES: mechanosensitive ion channel [unclassified Sutcliffiella]|uniref:mechanosensitive ion channel n=1 Tax=unclassified Sutcliffiella TaxID=2837532 RepID=UPI0030CC273F
MNDANYSFQNALNSLIEAIPNVIVALLLLLLAWIVATVVKAIVVKLFVKVGLTKAMAKSRMVKSEAQGKSVLHSIGKVIYFLVFILFLPSILDALNMRSVSQPITDMVQKFLAFLPNLFAAAILLIIGYFIARLVRDLIHNLLLSLNIDHWFDRLGGTSNTARGTAASPNTNEAQINKGTLAKIISNILFAVILIPIVTVALETLNIRTISEPIVSVLTTILNMIPNIFVAIILVLAGYYLAKFAAQLLTGLLRRTGINNIYQSMGLEQSQAPRFDLVNIIGQTVKILIILFFTVEALNVLNLDVLNNIGNAIILYLPMVISALIILGLALFGGNLLQKVLKKYTNSSFAAALVKYIIIVFAVFMALDQLGFAKTIVNIGFLLVLGALSIAFAISFGIGGRDFAKRNLERFEKKMEKDQNTPNTQMPNTPNTPNTPNKFDNNDFNGPKI